MSNVKGSLLSRAPQVCGPRALTRRTVIASCVTLACAGAYAIWFSTVSGAEPETKGALATDPKGWASVQPAGDLNGWTRVPIPPTNHLGRAQWHVDGARGVLVCDGDGGHDMLRLDRELTNCIFHVEFRYVPVTAGKSNYNSGVFIRNSAQGEIWHQAQLTMDGGYLFGNTPVNGQIKRYKLSPTERRMKPAGEWNVIEVSANGKVLVVWLNGAVTCSYDNCEVTNGYVALEAEGYAIEFRNLKLKVL